MASTCTLHILHTNDLHSHFASMPQIASCFKQHRRDWQAEGSYVLTVDIGDHADRMSMQSEATWGKANTAILNQSGYQYVTIGNNEGMTLPKDKLDELYEQATFTVVLGNLRDLSGSRPQWAVPYAIHEWPDVRVAILGVTVALAPFYQMLGWQVEEPLNVLREQVVALRSQVDAVIVLSHLGYQMDLRLAKELSGIDVILGAHTHHLLPNGEYVNSTLIAQAGKYGDFIGHVALTIDPCAKHVTASSAEVFDSHDYPYDPELEQLILQQQQAAKDMLNTPVASLQRPYEIDWDEETPFATFLAASLKKWTDADVSFVNAGVLLSPLPAGTVTKYDLLQALPHPINPCTVVITGGQLLTVLERAIQPEMVGRELRGFGFRGKRLGWMNVDGMSLQYTDGAVRRIHQVCIDGKPLIPATKYRVATADMFMFNRLFPELLEGADIHYFIPEVLREIVAATICDERLVAASFQPRWHKLEA